MTRKGQAELALGAGVWFSAVGGIAGVLSLMILAPPLAEIALSFSTFEYFWLALLGLMCATLVARSSPVKAIAGMHQRMRLRQAELCQGILRRIAFGRRRRLLVLKHVAEVRLHRAHAAVRGELAPHRLERAAIGDAEQAERRADQREVFGGNARKAMAAFIEKRKPVNKNR